MRSPARCIVCVLLCALLAAPFACAARAPFRWQRLAVTRALPSQVFDRLGLTHLTRRGYTRDGAKKGDPDPLFPPGLTDVVPSDAERVLLARGTPEGLAAFQARVDAMQAQIASERWRIAVQLFRPDTAGDVLLGSEADVETSDDASVMAVAGPADAPRAYQLRVHVAANGALSVSCQAGASLPPSAAPVWTPSQVWLPGAAKAVAAGQPVTFDDTAARRGAGRLKMGLPPETDTADYAVRVTVTAAAPAPAAEPTPNPLPSGDGAGGEGTRLSSPLPAGEGSARPGEPGVGSAP